MFGEDLFWDLQAVNEANGAPDDGEERARGTTPNVAAAVAGDDGAGAATWIQHLAEHGPAGVVFTPRALASQTLCPAVGAEQRVSGEAACTHHPSAATHSATDPAIGIRVSGLKFGRLAVLTTRKHARAVFDDALAARQAQTTAVPGECVPGAADTVSQTPAAMPSVDPSPCVSGAADTVSQTPAATSVLDEAVVFRTGEAASSDAAEIAVPPDDFDVWTDFLDNGAIGSDTSVLVQWPIGEKSYASHDFFLNAEPATPQASPDHDATAGPLHTEVAEAPTESDSVTAAFARSVHLKPTRLHGTSIQFVNGLPVATPLPTQFLADTVAALPCHGDDVSECDAVVGDFRWKTF